MISVIICSIDDSRFHAVTRTYEVALRGQEYEIIRIPDARSMAEGYNRGITRSNGDLLIFSHDDLEILSPIGEKLVARMQQFDLLGVAGTTLLVTGRWISAGPPHLYGQVAVLPPNQEKYDLLLWSVPAPVVSNIQALDGLFICAKRTVAEQIRWDEETFKRFHLYDIDFSYAAYLAGYKLAVACDFDVVHFSYGKFDEQWQAEMLKFNQKYRRRLPRYLPPEWTGTHVVVRSKEELVRAMTPPHFPSSASA
ncbi:MAG TPA: glycosyltransferase [Tepidisphaeraceae bacterium]|jgi:GT2 family glycosyltransferase